MKSKVDDPLYDSMLDKTSVKLSKQDADTAENLMIEVQSAAQHHQANNLCVKGTIKPLVPYEEPPAD